MASYRLKVIFREYNANYGMFKEASRESLRQVFTNLLTDETGAEHVKAEFSAVLNLLVIGGHPKARDLIHAVNVEKSAKKIK